mmetsp:Transcript_69985/g.216381  ORF Transcript_69985/g.216381 Transcript_69985/m.216381 type:complete len:213 (-) Transcript_69985:96-734(-)
MRGIAARRSSSLPGSAARYWRRTTEGSQHTAAAGSTPIASSAIATNAGLFGGSTCKWSPARYSARPSGKRSVMWRTLRPLSDFWHSSRLAAATSRACMRGTVSAPRPSFSSASALASRRTSMAAQMSAGSVAPPPPRGSSSRVNSRAASASAASSAAPGSTEVPPTARSSEASQSSKSESKDGPSTSQAPSGWTRSAPQRSRAASTSRGNCW